MAEEEKDQQVEERPTTDTNQKIESLNQSTTATTPQNEYGEVVVDKSGKPIKGTLVPAGPKTNERAAMEAWHYHEPTAQEREAEQKKRDKSMRWAKLNDAIAAMSNLYFTSKYAPNAFDPNNLGTTKLRERYDKIDADRDAQRQAWWNARLQGRKQDEDEAENARGWRYKWATQRQGAQDAAAKRASDERMNAAKIASNEKMNTENIASKEKMNDADNATKIQQTKINTYGNQKYYDAYEPLGNGKYKKHQFTSAEEALNHALGWGTAVEDWLEETTTDNSNGILNGGTKTKKTLRLRPGLPEDEGHFSTRRSQQDAQ